MTVLPESVGMAPHFSGCPVKEEKAFYVGQKSFKEFRDWPVYANKMENVWPNHVS